MYMEQVTYNGCTESLGGGNSVCKICTRASVDDTVSDAVDERLIVA